MSCILETRYINFPSSFLFCFRKKNKNLKVRVIFVFIVRSILFRRNFYYGLVQVTSDKVLEAIEGHVLGEAVLIAHF